MFYKNNGMRLSLVVVVLFAAAVQAAEYPGTASKWQDFDCLTFEMEGRTCTLIKPATPADGAPWLFRATAPEPDSVLDRRLLDKGFHIAWMEVEELYGNADAVQRWNAFYAWATKTLGLAAKPAIAGSGAGSLLLYNWAAQQVDNIACLYAEQPWLQLSPVPPQEEATLQKVMAAHGIDNAEAFNATPAGCAAVVGGAEIPIMHLYGERRPGTVPDKSIEQFYASYRLAGKGEYQSITMPTVREGVRHDVTVAASVFLLKHTNQLPGMPMDEPMPAMPDWKVADFAGRAEVRLLDDILVIEEGNDMTGIVYAKEPPLLNYEIVLDAMRLGGGDFFCGLTAPYKDTSFSLVVGGWGGTCVGISSLDWLDAYHNETAKFRSFEDHRWYRIRLRVTEGTIQAWIDGEETVNVSVAERDVDIRWEMAPTKPLGIATWCTTGAVRNFSIHPIIDPTSTDDIQ